MLRTIAQMEFYQRGGDDLRAISLQRLAERYVHFARVLKEENRARQILAGMKVK